MNLHNFGVQACDIRRMATILNDMQGQSDLTVVALGDRNIDEEDITGQLHADRRRSSHHKRHKRIRWRAVLQRLTKHGHGQITHLLQVSDSCRSMRQAGSTKHRA